MARLREDDVISSQLTECLLFEFIYTIANFFKKNRTKSKKKKIMRDILIGLNAVKTDKTCSPCS